MVTGAAHSMHSCMYFDWLKLVSWMLAGSSSNLPECRRRRRWSSKQYNVYFRSICHRYSKVF
ncbi:hypothetical protein BRADI_2g53478v3 [Brachypodium distachyon]|uniref:Uncharacterized protein n=1 Tax=Brachypodium distachyon TaxID=15368 RepID=A0A0Q3GGY9_BRADI|nr:hypothetical protein BRADI_2g53478v3 [Brachypodium distachyon]